MTNRIDEGDRRSSPEGASGAGGGSSPSELTQPPDEDFNPLSRFPSCLLHSQPATLWVSVEIRDPRSQNKKTEQIPLCQECAAHFGIETSNAPNPEDAPRTSVLQQYLINPLRRILRFCGQLSNRLRNRYELPLDQLKDSLSQFQPFGPWMVEFPGAPLRVTGVRFIPPIGESLRDAKWMGCNVRYENPDNILDPSALNEIELHIQTIRSLIESARPSELPQVPYYLGLDIAYFPEQGLVTEVYQEPSLLSEQSLEDFAQAVRQLPRPRFETHSMAVSVFMVFGYQTPESAHLWRTPFQDVFNTHEACEPPSQETRQVRLARYAEPPGESPFHSPWGMVEFNEFLRIDAENPWARIQRSRFYSEQGDFVRAAEDALFVAGLPNMTDYWRAWAYLRYARNQFSLENRAEGASAVRKGLEISPESPELRLLAINLLFDFQDLKTAEEVLATANQLGIRSALLDTEYGRLKWYQGDFEQAEHYFERAIEIDPQYPLVWHHRGSLYATQNRWAEAEQDLTRCLECLGTSDETLKWETYLRRGRARWEMRKIDGAIADFNEVLSVIPEDEECLLSRSQLFLSEGKIELAIQDAQQILKKSPDQVAAWGICAAAHFQLEQFDESLAAGSRAIELGWRHANSFCDRAAIWLTRQQFEEALADIESALEVDPEHSRAHDLRGLLYESEGEHQWSLAEESYSKAIQFSPEWGLPNFHRANLLSASKRSEEALADYRQTVALIPSFSTGWKMLGACYASRDETEEALEAFAKAIQVDPELIDGYLERGVLLGSAARYEEAIRDFNAVLERKPDHELALMYRAKSFTATERFDQAIDDYSHWIDLDPSIPAFLGRAHAWLKKDVPDEAEKDFDAAIRLQPELADSIQVEQYLIEGRVAMAKHVYLTAIEKANAALEIQATSMDAMLLRGTAKWYGESWVEAVEDYTSVIEQDPESWGAYCGRGQVRAELGEYAEAIADLDRVIDQEAENAAGMQTSLAYAFNGRGLARSGLGQWEEALEDFDRSICLAPANSLVHYHLGCLYERQGKREAAILCFRLALVLNHPRLPPRKRDRGLAYLDRYQSPSPPTGPQDASSNIPD